MTLSSIFSPENRSEDDSEYSSFKPFLYHFAVRKYQENLVFHYVTLSQFSLLVISTTELKFSIYTTKLTSGFVVSD